MKRIFLLVLTCLLFSSNAAAAENSDLWQRDPGKHENGEGYLNCIESGTANWFDFIGAIRAGETNLYEVSPSAVANYMEAIADEGMLELIPSEYFRNEEIKTALSVVFEDSDNVFKNRDIYASYLDRAILEGFLNEIERGEANWYDLVFAIQSQQIRFDWLSPSAVANYMEAIADEGMLEMIPSEYFRNEEIKTALSVVFEDQGNAVSNQRVYEDYLIHAKVHNKC